MIKTSKLSPFLSIVPIIVFLLVIFSPVANGAIPDVTAGAQELCNKNPENCPVSSIDDIWRILATVVRYTYTIFFIVAVIFILVAAFSFLTAKGDPTAIVAARSQIVWAVVAIIVALLSVGAAQIINNFLSNPA